MSLKNDLHHWPAVKYAIVKQEETFFSGYLEFKFSVRHLTLKSGCLMLLSPFGKVWHMKQRRTAEANVGSTWDE